MSAKPSLEERVNFAHRRLVLIHAAANASEDVADEGEVMAAIADVAHEAAEALEPVTHAPAEIANWTPKGGAR